MLAHLDKLENSPVYYTRTQEQFELVNVSNEEHQHLKVGEIIEAGIYLLKNFRQDLLNLPFLLKYSGQNEQGKVYVKP